MSFFCDNCVKHSISGYTVNLNDSAIDLIMDTTIRIKVKSDAYDFQSYAVADILKKEDLTWSRLCNIPYSAMATKPSLRYQPNLGLQHFFTDINSLLTKAEMILV